MYSYCIREIYLKLFLGDTFKRIVDLDCMSSGGQKVIKVPIESHILIMRIKECVLVAM